MLSKIRIELTGVVFLLLVSACSNDEDPATTDNTTGVTRKDHEGRGSAACQDWQFAYCEFVTARCDFGLTGKINECLEDYGTLVCVSDDTAADCAEKFKNAGYCAQPSVCLLYDVVDPAPAVEQCNTFVEKWCEHEIECESQDDMDVCKKELMIEYKCTQIWGTYLNYEECLEAVEALDCDEEELPESCGDLFYDLSAGTK